MKVSEKIGRTVRLESNVNERLIALCDHLGVNVNAYLVGEIGKAISRDEVSFRVADHSDQSKEMLNDFFAKVMNELPKE